MLTKTQSEILLLVVKTSEESLELRAKKIEMKTQAEGVSKAMRTWSSTAEYQSVKTGHQHFEQQSRRETFTLILLGVFCLCFLSKKSSVTLFLMKYSYFLEGSSYNSV